MICNVEVWKVIDNYPDYEVSNKGQVRSWKSLSPTARKPKEPKIRKQTIDNRGYRYVGLSKNGRAVIHAVHRLVLAAFDKPMPSEIDCCHKNGNPNDNRVENLYWGTRKENMADQLEHGTRNFGERNGQSKLSAECVMKMLAQCRSGESHGEVAKRFGVIRQNVTMIMNGRRWSHLTGIKYQPKRRKVNV